MHFQDKVAKLNLPSGSYMVVGSGLLDVLEIRKSGDVDVLVSKEAFRILRERGWKIETREDGTQKIFFGMYDCMTDWYGKSLEESLQDARYIEGVPYLDLQGIHGWKKRMNRRKDATDVELIEKYLLTKDRENNEK